MCVWSVEQTQPWLENFLLVSPPKSKIATVADPGPPPTPGFEAPKLSILIFLYFSPASLGI